MTEIKLITSNLIGPEIKILIGDYLHITQSEAVELLFAELPNAEIRLFESAGFPSILKRIYFEQIKIANV